MAVNAIPDQGRADELIASLFDGTVADPYPIYDELREASDGIYWSEDAHAYIVTRFDHAKEALCDPAKFSSDVFWDTPQAMHDPEQAEHLRFVDVNSRLFMFADPPFHTRVRSSFKRAFTPPAMSRWRPIVENVTNRMMESHKPGDEIEVMEVLASTVPVKVIAHIIGVPEDMHDKFRHWSYAYASSFDPMVQGDRRDEVIKTSVDLMDYLAELITERRREPTDDLTSVLLSTETTTGDHLEDLELLAALTLILVAGNETTTNVIGTGISRLCTHPDQRDELAADASLIPGAVEEMIRYEPPIHFLFRKTVEDVQLGDHALEAGTMLFVCPPAANRDPRRFENPTTFDIHRSDNRHVSFAHGIHFCVGAALARLELVVVMEQMLKHYPKMEFGSKPAIRRSSNSTVRGYDSLPVRL